jgi:chromosome segregation ATPase
MSDIFQFTKKKCDKVFDVETALKERVESISKWIKEGGDTTNGNYAAYVIFTRDYRDLLQKGRLYGKECEKLLTLHKALFNDDLVEFNKDVKLGDKTFDNTYLKSEAYNASVKQLLVDKNDEIMKEIQIRSQLRPKEEEVQEEEEEEVVVGDVNGNVRADQTTKKRVRTPAQTPTQTPQKLPDPETDKQEILRLQEEIRKYDEIVGDKIRKNNDLNIKVKEMQAEHAKEVEALQADVKDTIKENHTLKSHIQDMTTQHNNQVTQLQTQIQNITAQHNNQVTQLQAQLQQADYVTKQNKAYDDAKYRSLEMDYQNLEQNFKFYKGEQELHVGALEQTVKSYIKDIASRDTQIKNLGLQLHGETERLKATIKQVNDEKTLTENQKSAITAELEAAKNEITNLTNHLENIQRVHFTPPRTPSGDVKIKNDEEDKASTVLEGQSLKSFPATPEHNGTDKKLFGDMGTDTKTPDKKVFTDKGIDSKTPDKKFFGDMATDSKTPVRKATAETGTGQTPERKTEEIDLSS